MQHHQGGGAYGQTPRNHTAAVRLKTTSNTRTVALLPQSFYYTSGLHVDDIIEICVLANSSWQQLCCGRWTLGAERNGQQAQAKAGVISIDKVMQRAIHHCLHSKAVNCEYLSTRDQGLSEYTVYALITY